MIQILGRNDVIISQYKHEGQMSKMIGWSLLWDSIGWEAQSLMGLYLTNCFIDYMTKCAV